MGAKRKKKAVYTALVAVLAVGAVAVLSCRIWYVNEDTPLRSVIEYTIGEAAWLDGENSSGNRISEREVSVSVSNTTLLGFEEAKARFPDYLSKMLASNPELQLNLCLVELELRNYSEREQEVPIYDFQLQSGAWHNAITLELFEELNGSDNTVAYIESGGVRQITLVYSINDLQFGSVNAMRESFNKPFYLVLSSYPNKVEIDLGTPSAFDSREE